MKALHKRHGRVGKLKRELKKAKRNDVVFCDLYTPDDARWEYFNLFVLMEKIDSELHRKTVCANGEKGDWPTTTVVFPHSMIRHQKNARETIKHYLNEEDILLEFEVQEYLFSMSVIINTQYISYRQFVEKIVPVFEKHGFHFNDLTDPFAEYSLADKQNSEKDTRVTMSVKICTKIFATILGRIGTLVGVFVGIIIDDVLSKIKEIMHKSGE